MSNTIKPFSEFDNQQIHQKSFNQESGTIGVDGFLAGLVGRRIDLAISTTTIGSDTETYSFSENGTPLFSYKVVYTDGSRSLILYAVRIS